MILFLHYKKTNPFNFEFSFHNDICFNFDNMGLYFRNKDFDFYLINYWKIIIIIIIVWLINCILMWIWFIISIYSFYWTYFRFYLSILFLYELFYYQFLANNYLELNLTYLKLINKEKNLIFFLNYIYIYFILLNILLFFF